MQVYSAGIIVWDITDGTYILCEKPPDPVDPPGGQANWGATASPYGFSDDGRHIVGLAIGAGYLNVRPARWDDGVMTLLDAVPVAGGGGPMYPRKISADGSVALGYPGVNWGYARWANVGGGPAMIGAPLPPAPGGIIASWAYEIGRERAMSSDGRVIIGSTAGAYATVWVDGVPANLSSPNYDYTRGISMSSDGNTLLMNVGGETTQGGSAGFWRRSEGVFKPTRSSNWVRACNTDGTVIWSDYGNAGTYGYTDNLNSVDGNGFYGTFHGASVIGSYQGQSYFAEDTFSPNPISVGSFQGSSGETVVRVTGVNTVALNSDPYTRAIASGVSGNGQIISGFVDSGDARGWLPVYWDNLGVMHMLPVPAGWNYLNQTIGVSRDGRKIIGTLSTFTTIPDPPPVDVPLALRLVGLEPQDLPANTFALFSDSSNDFPFEFGQYSLSVWCCENVTIRWPQTDPALGLITATPAQCYVEFRDNTNTLLFYGTFHNPTPDPPVMYQLKFSIDTVARIVSCWGNNSQWTPVGTYFDMPGSIGNVVS